MLNPSKNGGQRNVSAPVTKIDKKYLHCPVGLNSLVAIYAPGRHVERVK